MGEHLELPVVAMSRANSKLRGSRCYTDSKVKNLQCDLSSDSIRIRLVCGSTEQYASLCYLAII